MESRGWSGEVLIGPSLSLLSLFSPSISLALSLAVFYSYCTALIVGVMMYNEFAFSKKKTATLKDY